MSERQISSRAFFAGLAVGGGLLLAGCDNKIQNPEIGDTGVAKEKIEGIIDYNQIKFPKDTCEINPEENFEIVGESYLRLPSKESYCLIDKATGKDACFPESNIQEVLQLEGENGCTVWLLPDVVNESTDLDNK